MAYSFLLLTIGTYNSKNGKIYLCWGFLFFRLSIAKYIFQVRLYFREFCNPFHYIKIALVTAGVFCANIRVFARIYCLIKSDEKRNIPERSKNRMLLRSLKNSQNANLYILKMSLQAVDTKYFLGIQNSSCWTKIDKILLTNCLFNKFLSAESTIQLLH